VKRGGEKEREEEGGSWHVGVTRGARPGYDGAMPDRFEHLSISNSGLHYVRERKGGVMRVLTDSELADFNDPPPCPHCAEQFGCEHFNCAGEPLLDEAQLESHVPPEWLAFARASGVSERDLERLRAVEVHEGAYRVGGGVEADVRMMEIVLLLNEGE